MIEETHESVKLDPTISNLSRCAKIDTIRLDWIKSYPKGPILSFYTMDELSSPYFFKRLKKDRVIHITNLYIDRYGQSDDFLTANFSDDAFKCLSKLHMFDWLNNTRPPKVNLPFTVSMFIFFVKSSLSDTYSVSYETSKEANQC